MYPNVWTAKIDRDVPRSRFAHCTSAATPPSEATVSASAGVFIASSLSVAAVASRNGAFASFTTPAIAHGTHPASTTAAARSSECRAIVARHANALAAARGATPSSATALAADASSATLAAA